MYQWPIDGFWTYVQYTTKVCLMSHDGAILRALLRLARRRVAASENDVSLRVRGAPNEVRTGLRRLRAQGLVATPEPERWVLTMPGLAFAVAMLPSRPEQAITRGSSASRAA
jgi:hypothetical protein